MVGMERKNENSRAASRDRPATCPAAIVHIEREVPGKTAERIWTAPIQIAAGRLIASIRMTRGLTNSVSTIHITIPPMSNASAMTSRFSRFFPISFVRRKAGTAVTTKAIATRLRG